MQLYRLLRRWRHISFLFLILVYIVLSLHNWAWYNRPLRHICETSADDMQNLINLAKDTHIALQKLNLTNFLIYGSLWGALRNKAPLIWDNDFDIGIVLDEVSPITEKLLYKELQDNKIDIYYRYWFGTYRVTRGTARGDLMLFRRNWNDNCVRTGIESWLFFVNYKRHHTFPCRLIAKPLPWQQFSDMNFTVPREGNDIQRYFYPDDWWLVKKPVGC